LRASCPGARPPVSVLPIRGGAGRRCRGRDCTAMLLQEILQAGGHLATVGAVLVQLAAVSSVTSRDQPWAVLNATIRIGASYCPSGRSCISVARSASASLVSRQTWPGDRNRPARCRCRGLCCQGRSKANGTLRNSTSYRGNTAPAKPNGSTREIIDFTGTG
jgi:hypothetical protein